MALQMKPNRRITRATPSLDHDEVVEAIADNTLGSIWYEMTKGNTRLKNQCRHLVRHDQEQFFNGLSVECFKSYSSHMEPWVRSVVLTGDFSVMPEIPSWGAISYFALILDGYAIAEAHQHVGELDDYTQIYSIIEGNRPIPEGDQLQLWLLLFSFQRHFLKEFDPELEDKPYHSDKMLSVYEALRTALRSPCPITVKGKTIAQPFFIPHRPIRDPRTIRIAVPKRNHEYFKKYCTSLYETMYLEAWDRELISKDEFGAKAPPFPHDTVRMKSGIDSVLSNNIGTMIPFDTARLVILEIADPGDGMESEMPYISPPESKYRVPIKCNIPLSSFDYMKFLKEGWFTPEKGERFVRRTQCWDHGPSDPFSPDVVYQNFVSSIPQMVADYNFAGKDKRVQKRVIKNA